MQNFHRIVEAVQTNCYINDARHAQDMTMCTYLLEMRQFYRWEHSLPYSQRLPKDDLGSWLTEREEMEVFNVINSKAKGLSSSLLDYHEAQLATDLGKERPELLIALHLNDAAESPWLKQLDLGGSATSGNYRRASLRTMQKAVKRFLASTNVLQTTSAEDAARLVLEFWIAVVLVLEEAWKHPRRHFLTKGIGVYALMGLLAVACLIAGARFDRTLALPLILLMVWNVAGLLALMQVAGEEKTIQYSATSAYLAIAALVFACLFLLLVLADLSNGHAVLPAFVLGLIYLGYSSPTEAGGFACLYAMIVGLYVYRSMSWNDVLEAAARVRALAAAASDSVPGALGEAHTGPSGGDSRGSMRRRSMSGGAPMLT